MRSEPIDSSSTASITPASSIQVGHQHHSFLTYIKEEHLWTALQEECRVVEHPDASGDAALGAGLPSFSSFSVLQSPKAPKAQQPGNRLANG